MTFRILAAVAALTVATAASASAAERRPLGQPSAPTVYGHEAAESYAPPLAEVDLRRQAVAEAPARDGSLPSEPTVWGHRPNVSR